MTEILKTPGKLRGKTPRTARNRNPLDNRQVQQMLLVYSAATDFL